MGARHVLGDQAADAAQRLAPALCGSQRVAADMSRSGSADIGLGDPSARAGPGDRRRVDAELLGDPADERRRLDPSGGDFARV